MRPASTAGTAASAWHAEPPSGAPYPGRIPDRAGGRDPEQLPGAGRQAGDLPPEPLLDPVHQGKRARRPEAAGQFHQGPVARQLPERQRVTSRLAEHPLPDSFVQSPSHHRGQQLPCFSVRQALDGEIRQPEQVGAWLPDGDYEQDGLGQQAARGEGQGPSGRPVQPVAVIDQTDQRTVLGRLGQQAEHRQANEEMIWWRPGSQAERGRERVALWLRQPRQATEQGGAELVERGERQLHLRFHAGRPEQPQVPRRPGCIVQQRALADPGLAADHQDTAAPSPDRMEEPVEYPAFSVPVEERQGRSGERTEVRHGQPSRCSSCRTRLTNGSVYHPSPGDQTHIWRSGGRGLARSLRARSRCGSPTAGWRARCPGYRSGAA